MKIILSVFDTIDNRGSLRTGYAFHRVDLIVVASRNDSCFDQGRNGILCIGIDHIIYRCRPTVYCTSPAATAFPPLFIARKAKTMVSSRVMEEFG